MVSWLSEKMRRLGHHDDHGAKMRRRVHFWNTHPPKLTEAQKYEIRRLRKQHTLAQIGAKFNRHPSTIAVICGG